MVDSNSQLYIAKKQYDEIISHARRSYPHEGCGALAGKLDEGGKKWVLKTYMMENVNKKRANDRYEIDSGEFLKIEKEASSNGLEILGFFHSHPDHPEFPSDFDRERAWPIYSYLIVSVRGGEEIALKSWVLKDEEGDFVEEDIEIEG